MSYQGLVKNQLGFGAKIYSLAKKVVIPTNCAASFTGSKLQLRIQLEELIKLNSQIFNRLSTTHSCPSDFDCRAFSPHLF